MLSNTACFKYEGRYPMAKLQLASFVPCSQPDRRVLDVSKVKPLSFSHSSVRATFINKVNYLVCRTLATCVYALDPGSLKSIVSTCLCHKIWRMAEYAANYLANPGQTFNHSIYSQFTTLCEDIRCSATFCRAFCRWMSYFSFQVLASPKRLSESGLAAGTRERSVSKLGCCTACKPRKSVWESARPRHSRQELTDLTVFGTGGSGCHELVQGLLRWQVAKN